MKVAVLYIEKYMRTTPWWLVAMLFLTTWVIGVYLGAPLAVIYYDLSIPSEVGVLFALMPLVYFYALIPFCLLSAMGLMVVRTKAGKLISAVYILSCIIAIPTVFFGIGVSNYYG